MFCFVLKKTNQFFETMTLKQVPTCNYYSINKYFFQHSINIRSDKDR